MQKKIKKQDKDKQAQEQIIKKQAKQEEISEDEEDFQIDSKGNPILNTDYASESFSERAISLLMKQIQSGSILYEEFCHKKNDGGILHMIKTLVANRNIISHYLNQQNIENHKVKLKKALLVLMAKSNDTQYKKGKCKKDQIFDLSYYRQKF